MTDRPILFSAPMVRALLAGTKTQTRRILKPLPNRTIFFDALKAGLNQHQSPRFASGDRLWVRETWQALSFGDYQPTKSSQSEVRYAATDPCADLETEARGYPWRPSIFMPRWASRITLTVTDVRIERLQDISEADAVAEGCFKGKASGRVFANEAAMHLGGDEWANARDWYADLWDIINGPGAWDANPWVVAYTFTVHRGNIDEAV